MTDFKPPHAPRLAGEDRHGEKPVTDLEKFFELAQKCGAARTTSRGLPAGRRAHVEAEFDTHGNILSLGSYWDDNEMESDA